MDEAMYEVLYPLLYRLGVPADSVSALLDHGALEARRFRLRTYGGSRLEAYRTEMRAFRSEFKKPSVGYLLFKYLVMGGATLLLPPRQFYEARDWYAQRKLGRVRDWLFKSGGKQAEAEKAWPSRSK